MCWREDSGTVGEGRDWRVLNDKEEFTWREAENSNRKELHSAKAWRQERT